MEKAFDRNFAENFVPRVSKSSISSTWSRSSLGTPENFEVFVFFECIIAINRWMELEGIFLAYLKAHLQRKRSSYLFKEAPFLVEKSIK